MKYVFIVIGFGLLLVACETKKLSEEQEQKEGIETTEADQKKEDALNIEKEEENRSLNTSGEIAPPDSFTIVRSVRGEDISLTLDGGLNWSKEYKGHEYPLTIRELYPGVVLFKEYHEDTVVLQEEDKIYYLERPVPYKIEYFSESGTTLSLFKVEEHNPYLRPPSSIEVRQYYDDAERTYYLPESKRTGNEKVDQYFVQTVVEQKGAYTCIHYRAKQLTSGGLILGIQSTMMVLDTTGRQLIELEVDQLTSMPAISKDGNYLMFSYLPIETTSNAGVKTQIEGFEIWNIPQKKRIYREENDDPDMWVSTPSLDEKSGIVRLRYTFPNSEKIADKLYLFDPHRLELYSRVRSKKESSEVTKKWFTYYKDYRKVLKEFKFDTLKLGDNE